MEFQASLESPLGKLGLRTNGTELLHIDFLQRNAPLIKPETYIAKEAVVQLQCYFADPLYKFNLVLSMQGTDFQKKVWRELVNIPVGQTLSYGELAAKLKSSAQAIGNACRVNPLPIVIPCHRIVAHDGLGGYSGDTSGEKIDYKKWLLAHEAQAKTKQTEEHKIAEALF